jgi:hypothetical protein
MKKLRSVECSFSTRTTIRHVCVSGSRSKKKQQHQEGSRNECKSNRESAMPVHRCNASKKRKRSQLQQETIAFSMSSSTVGQPDSTQFRLTPISFVRDADDLPLVPLGNDGANVLLPQESRLLDFGEDAEAVFGRHDVKPVKFGTVEVC